MTTPQLRRFLELLPDWDDVAEGLDAIVFDPLADDMMGWHDDGVVALCAWDRDLWWPDTDREFIEDHRDLLDLLAVERVDAGGQRSLRWTEPQARAFQLLHVLPHELGHHKDRMTTRSRRQAARGERYAERYANRVAAEIWNDYVDAFGV